jgi:hypothetical protein
MFKSKDPNTPKVTLVCKTCGQTARRRLLNEPGSRGIHETCSEPALCPRGHGEMVRQDGNNNVHAKDCLG